MEEIIVYSIAAIAIIIAVWYGYKDFSSTNKFINS